MARKITITIDDERVESHLRQLHEHLNSVPKVKRLPLALLINQAILKLTEADVQEIWDKRLKGEERFWYQLYERGLGEDAKGEFLQQLLDNFTSGATKQKQQRQFPGPQELANSSL